MIGSPSSVFDTRIVVVTDERRALLFGRRQIGRLVLQPLERARVEARFVRARHLGVSPSIRDATRLL